MRSANDDVGDGRGNADLNTGVAFLGQLALEELVELGIENTVGDELAALGDVDTTHALGGRFGFLHVGWYGMSAMDLLAHKQGLSTISRSTDRPDPPAAAADTAPW